MRGLILLLKTDASTFARFTESELRIQAAAEEVTVRRKIAAVNAKADIASEIKRLASERDGTGCVSSP